MNKNRSTAGWPSGIHTGLELVLIDKDHKTGSLIRTAQETMPLS